MDPLSVTMVVTLNNSFGICLGGIGIKLTPISPISRTVRNTNST